MKITYSGIWPVAPSVFKENGELDLEGNRRVIECMIDQNIDGICILANFSEQFLLSDNERTILTKLVVEQISGRVPVIVTVSHFSTDIVLNRAQFCKDLGVDMVMLMPPYHGALLKGSEQQTFQQISEIDKIKIPIMIQDAPLSGVNLSAKQLARMFKKIEMLKAAKIESLGTAEKIRKLLSLAGEHIDGLFDGEEGITLLADLKAGATGSMTSATIPDILKTVITNFQKNKDLDTFESYKEALPIIVYENKLCGFRACKEAMLAGNVIKSAFCRHPIEPLSENIKNEFLTLLKRLDPIVLKWGL